MLSIAVIQDRLYDCNHMKTKAGMMPEPGPLPSSLPLLAGVTPIRRAVPAGATLFHKGDRTTGIFVLAEGAIRLARVTPDGATVTLHQVRPGETFAEASLFGTHYHCNAIADADSAVGLYPQAALMARLRADPDALWNFSRELALRLQSLRQRYELKQIRSASERVFQFLLLRCNGDGCFHATGTLKDVATELGLTHEAFYRALATLQRRKLISRQEGSISLVSKGRIVKTSHLL